MEVDPHHSPVPTGFRLDAWLASSLLQKAIRRSEAAIACGAAMAYFRARGPAIWRRLQVIAAEDVGIGSVEALSVAAASADPDWRAHIGGDRSAIIHVTRLLSGAPKDRSAEHLTRLCRDFAGYDNGRDHVAALSDDKRLQLIASAHNPLPVRAIATWFASGLNIGEERRLRGGDIPGVLDALRSAGVPEQLVTATGIAARRTRNPMCLMPALVWREAQLGKAPAITEDPLPPSPMFGEIPAYALDKFTASGKTAIGYFAHQNDPVRMVLEAHVADFRAHDAVAMAVFYAEGGKIALRYDWDGSRDLEGLGTEQDFMGVGVSRSGVSALVSVVHANLAHLHEIRARLHRSKRSEIP